MILLARQPLISAPLTLGTISGTASSIRQQLEVSIHIAPALAATGQNSSLIEFGAQNKATSTPENEF